MAIAAWQFAGVLGLCGVCALARRLRRGWPREIELHIHEDQVTQVWMVSFALNVRGAGLNSWVFRDELDAPGWADLRRYLIAQVPVHPLGLSISR